MGKSEHNEVNVSRRDRIELNTPAELSIRSSIAEVKKMGLDNKVSQAIILLKQSLEFVSDFVDEAAKK